LFTNWLPHEKLVGTHADTVAALKNYALMTFLSLPSGDNPIAVNK